MSRARLVSVVLSVFLLVQWACVTAQHTPPHLPPTQPGAAGSSASLRPLAAVIAAPAGRESLTPAARAMVEEAAGDRICTRIYLSNAVDPTRTFTFDEPSVRQHIDRRAPSHEVGCLFVVDLEGDYFKALRRGNEDQVERAVDLYLQTVRTVKEARPGEPVMIYGLPNENWRRFDFSVLDEVFAEVDYINVSAYAGNDKTEARYCKRIENNVAISAKIADQFDLDFVAHVNPRYKDETRVPMDQFIAGMKLLKSKGIRHVVYWQAPWDRIPNLVDDGKPLTMSDDEWRAAVEQCYICALLKVFEPDNPVSRSCTTDLPGTAR